MDDSTQEAPPWSPVAVAKEILPGWPDEELQAAIWGRTGFPCFWAGDPETTFRRQLTAYAAAVTLGLNLCMWCSNEVGRKHDTCRSCDAALSRGRPPA